MGLALGVLVAVSYVPALTGGFVWDDVIFSEVPVIHAVSGLKSIWFSPADIRNEGHYWPLVYSSFWLEHKLSAAALANAGRALIHLGQLEEAEEHLGRAVQIDPRSTTAQQNLAEALRKQERYAEAVDSYSAVLEIALAHAGMARPCMRLDATWKPWTRWQPR